MALVDFDDFDWAVEQRFVLPRPRRFARPPVLPTPGALVDFVAANAAAAPETASVALKARAFYRVRRRIAALLEAPARGIGPRTRLSALMPDPAARARHWDALEAALQVPALPGLARPGAMERAIGAGAVAVWAGALVLLLRTLGPGSGGLLLAVAAVLGYAWLALRLTRRWRQHFVAPALTVGDLAAFCVAYGSPVLGVEAVHLSRSQVREVVADLLRLECAVARPRWDAPWAAQEQWPDDAAAP